jgi:hypothetical protein
VNVGLCEQCERPAVSARSRIGAMLGALLCASAAVQCEGAIHLGGEDAVIEAGAADANLDGSKADDASATLADARADGAGDELMSVDGRASVLWSATFEPGDFSEWESDGQGGTYNSLNTSHIVSAEQAHSGVNAAKLTIDPTNSIVEDIYLFRGISGAPAAQSEAYYAAWFYIPNPYIESFYWNIFHFLDGGTVDRLSLVEIWDVDLRSNDTGALVPYVYDFLARRQRDEPTPIPVPIGKWFHIEVLLLLASDATGRFAMWQDGVPVIDLRDVVTSNSPWIQWSVGSTSTDIMPAPSDLYIDDVTMSLARVGP